MNVKNSELEKLSASSKKHYNISCLFLEDISLKERSCFPCDNSYSGKS